MRQRRTFYPWIDQVLYWHMDGLDLLLAVWFLSQLFFPPCLNNSCVSAGSNFIGSVDPVPHVTDAFLLRTGTGRYVLGSDTIEFSPGRVEHTYTQVRGALPKWDGQSVYLTGVTPFDFKLTIG